MLPLKILSWNIEHFNGSGGQDKKTRALRVERVERVAQYIAEENPCIFGLSEVESNLVYDKFTKLLPEYNFHMTRGRQSQEILIAVKSDIKTCFSQLDEFKRNNPYLRPGALLTVRDGDTHIPILFTHLKSKSDPEGFGLRDAMFNRIFSLRLKLNEAEQILSKGNNEFANFIVLGDMNTMGMDYYRKGHDISLETEVNVVNTKFNNRGMKGLKKDSEFTFFNGSNSKYPPSELDHVFAANHLKFQLLDNGVSEVEVGGWAKIENESRKDQWIQEYSDHAPISFILNSIA